MMFCQAILLLVVIAAGSESAVVCDGLLFHGLYHNKEVLFQGRGNGRPYNLVMHKTSGLLFFSHTITNITKIDFGIMACHVKNKTCSHVPGITGGYAIAHDSSKDSIFFGGHDGIYKYNFTTKSADFFAEKNKSIWGLFIGKYFYYIEYPMQKLYVFHYNKFIEVESLKGKEVDNFFISKRYYMYYSNVTGLYKVYKAFSPPVVLERNIIVRQIIEDLSGDVYFCAKDGVYVEIKHDLRIRKVANIDDCYGLTFMYEDHKKKSKKVVLYSNRDSIYRLTPYNFSQICSKVVFKGNKKKEDSRIKRLIKQFFSQF